MCCPRRRNLPLALAASITAAVAALAYLPALLAALPNPQPYVLATVAALTVATVCSARVDARARQQVTRPLITTAAPPVELPATTVKVVRVVREPAALPAPNQVTLDLPVLDLEAVAIEAGEAR